MLTRIYHCEVQRPSDLTDLRNLKQGRILTARVSCSQANASQKQAGFSQEHDAPSHDMNDTVGFAWPKWPLSEIRAQCIQNANVAGWLGTGSEIEFKKLKKHPEIWIDSLWILLALSRMRKNSWSTTARNFCFVYLW